MLAADSFNDRLGNSCFSGSCSPSDSDNKRGCTIGHKGIILEKEPPKRFELLTWRLRNVCSAS
jgi:hypothetical protein